MKRGPQKLSSRQEKFCQLYVAGNPASVAYRRAGYAASERSSEACAAKLLRIDKVKRRIGELQAESKSMTDMDKAEAIRFLVEAVRTPVGQVDEMNPLAQEVVDGPWGKRVKMVPKLPALERLAKMLGWDDQDSKTLTELGQIISRIVDR